MLPLFKAIAIIALLFVQVSKQTDQIKSYTSGLHPFPIFTKHLSHPGKDLVLSYSLGENDTLAYALCDRHDDKREKKCVLTLETLGSDGQNYIKSCEINLSVTKEDETIARKFLLTQFGRNCVVFAWKEGQITKKSDKKLPSRWSNSMAKHNLEEHLKVRAVHMESCKFRETSVTVDQKDSSVDDKMEITSFDIVTYNDGVELFYRNRQLCGEERRCLITYDSKSNKFSIQYASPLLMDYNADSRIFPVPSSGSISSSDRIYAIDSLSQGQGQIRLNDALGHELVTKLYGLPAYEQPDKKWHLTHSNAQGTMGFGVLNTKRWKVEHMVFNREGGAFHEISIDSNPRDVRQLKILNTSNNGFLIMMGYAPEGVTDRFNGLDQMKYNSEGGFQYKYSLNGFECPVSGSNLEVNFYERSGFEYCYCIVCSSSKPESGKSKMDLNEYRLSFHRYCVA